MKKFSKRKIFNRMAASLCGLGLLATSCKSSTPDAGAVPSALSIKSVNTRAMVADQMRAAIEMQLSGEPLATIMGRNLANFIHFSPIPDQVALTPPPVVTFTIDPVGYSVAVESYEYSKMAMNHLSFESGAGLSLMYGPRLNPGGFTGSAALGLLRLRIQTLALESRAGATGTVSPWVVVPAPTDNPLNRLGFPGLWPQFAEFRSYDPTLAPSRDVQSSCTTTGANGGVFSSTNNYAGNAQYVISDYECSDNTLHLVDRDSQVEKVLAIDALGLTAWKQALWVINYFQFVHDVSGGQQTVVDAVDLGQVGQPGNTVQANNGDAKTSGMAGAFIGSSDLEGFQGLIMTEEIDNKAELLLKQLATTDGKTLGGFSTIKAALAYDYVTPLRFFPHALAVTEQPGADGAEAQPIAFTVQDSTSRLADLTALLGGYAELFALTDLKNPQVGGSSTVRVVFDGDPFPADNGLADGEQTPHDRALAVMKVALVNLDRMHGDPTTGALCDSAQINGQGVTRSTHVTTVETTYALVALRNAYRALTAQLTLYSDATPDQTATVGALDATSMAGAPGGVSVTARLQQLMVAQAQLLTTKLVGSDGTAVNGYDLSAGAPDGAATTLESQAAAVRGLLEAYLITSQTDYRDRAQQAYAVLDQLYYYAPLRIYRPVPGETQNFVFTPSRFGILQGALREMYIQVAARPGNDTLRADLETRIGRLNKLVLNGWDDANSDHKVDYPGECLRVVDGVPRSGMQLGERALTGELGASQQKLVFDFDQDCVPNLSYVNLPAFLASEVHFVAVPPVQ